MSDNGSGFLEVGTNEADEVVINLPRDMTGHVVFSTQEARALAATLLKKAGEAERQIAERVEAARLAAIPPVDRSNRCSTSGQPLTPDHREINPATGQQKDYVVLCDAERAKGFIRPVRDTYKHLTCGSTTTMGRKLAETYARDPEFYSGTFCATCRTHFPLVEFIWLDGEGLGT